MNGIIEAVYIIDEHNNPILSHTYAARPLPASVLVPLFLQNPTPRPNLLYLSVANPPTLVFHIVHANLTYLLTTTEEIEPLLALEFLHRVVDVLEEFLGAPILAQKIEHNYHVAAQLLTEMCDGGAVNTTEPNALRDMVEIEGWVGKLLGSINLPGKQNLVTTFQNSTSAIVSGAGPSALTSMNAPALPWRRTNVRHTSNEMYADVIENLTVTIAPSGRPIAAFAHGSIVFTSKVSGVPDILLTLTCPTGRQNLIDMMELPVFHPCVRLQRWKERPGELSFIPPDGRFVLAGYEVDLLPFSKSSLAGVSNLKLPVNVEVKTGLGAAGADFEVRIHLNKVFRWAGNSMPSGSGGMSSRGLGGGVGGLGAGSSNTGTPSNPLLEDVVVRIPLPFGVRNLSEIRPSRGDATYNPGDKFLEWHIPTKELAVGTPYFGLKCTVIGYANEEEGDGEANDDPMGFGFGKEYSYHESYETSSSKETGPKAGTEPTVNASADILVERDAKKVAQNKMLMPTSASVSFAVKGWLSSGIKVDGIAIDPRRSKGLGETVKPYKGVKYLTVSKEGVEVRC